MTRHLHWPIWIEWSIIQTQSSATTLGRSRAARPIRKSHSRPVNQSGAVSSYRADGPYSVITLAAQRRDVPQTVTSDTNLCETITPAAKKVIYQPEARARDPVRFPRWRVGLICSSMRNFLAGVI